MRVGKRCEVVVGQDESDWFSHPQFAKQLEARVVDESGDELRIHGFGVRSDLVRHFSCADVMLLALTGREPSERTSEALRRALVLLTPIRTGSAPAHVGILSHLVSRNYASSVAAATAVLAERAASCVGERTKLLEALRRGDSPIAESTGLRPDAPAEAEVGKLFENCSEFAGQSWFAHLDALSAAIAVLFECGLSEPWQFESMLFWAWCPCVMAEMGTRGQDSMESYPINLPKFAYVER